MWFIEETCQVYFILFFHISEVDRSKLDIACDALRRPAWLKLVRFKSASNFHGCEQAMPTSWCWSRQACGRAFLPHLLHDRQLAGRDVLCPKTSEQRWDTHLLRFPSNRGLQAHHHTSQDLADLQELCGLHWSLGAAPYYKMTARYATSILNLSTISWCSRLSPCWVSGL